MSKSGRNRQKASERIAQMRAVEAQWRRRRRWLAGAGAAVLAAGAAVGITPWHPAQAADGSFGPATC